MSTAAAAAVARKRVKRAMGQLRAAAAALAEAGAAELEVLGECHLERGDDPSRVLELVRLARQHRAAIDVVVLSSTPVDDRGRERQPEGTSPDAGTPPRRPRGAKE